jgi:hypothetical protein
MVDRAMELLQARINDDVDPIAAPLTDTRDHSP